jgi:hypothetical protein
MWYCALVNFAAAVVAVAVVAAVAGGLIAWVRRNEGDGPHRATLKGRRRN